MYYPISVRFLGEHTNFKQSAWLFMWFSCKYKFVETDICLLHTLKSNLYSVTSV